MMLEVRFFETKDGSRPVAEYMRGLDANERAKLATALWKLQEFGLEHSGVTLKPIEGKLWEIKVSAQRAFYCMLSGSVMVVLHAYYKKSQKAPQSDIDLARTRMEEVLGK